MTYEQHPLSAAFPSMSPDEYAGLVADIRQHGQRDVATLYDGMVIDGWHRYRACEEIGIPCRFEDFAGSDPAAFVISRNRHRRHLSKTQRAAAVVAVHAWRPPNAPGMPATSSKGDHGHPSATVRQMAAEAGVDERTIQRTKQGHTAGLGDAMRDGKVSARAAAEIAKAPEPDRKAMVERAKAGEKVSARPLAPVPPPDDDDGPTLEELVDELQAENTRLTAQIQAAEADDLAAEAIKWRRCYEQALRQQSEAMDRAAESQRREKWTMDQLRRCGRAVGVEDPKKIARAVESAVALKALAA